MTAESEHGPDPFAATAADTPPADAEEWNDEQWLAWLAATDDDPPTPASPPATRLGRLARSPAGTALGNAMTGMADALYGPRRNEVAVVAEAPGEPPGDDPFEVRLDPDHPERSQVVHRSTGADLRASPADPGTTGPEPGTQPGGRR